MMFSKIANTLRNGRSKNIVTGILSRGFERSDLKIRSFPFWKWLSHKRY